MKDKYYTPKLDEFHIGFEFEFYDEDDRDWTNTIIKSQTELCNWTGLGIKVRVKYLDKDDIEECSFELYYEGKNSKLLHFNSNLKDTRNDKVSLAFNYLTNWVLLYTGEFISMNPDDKVEKHITLFCGNIKNKSEFKRLLIQLGINQ